MIKEIIFKKIHFKNYDKNDINKLFSIVISTKVIIKK